MTNFCPLPTWRDLPSLDRKQLPAILFAPACLPGTATMKGCPAQATYYTVAMTWGAFITQGWQAPGGNRYYEKQLPLDTRDPLVVAILRGMAATSKRKWDFYSGFAGTYATGGTDSQRVGGWLQRTKMADVLAKGEWSTKHGVLEVELAPKPDETAYEFAKRGGYLFYTPRGNPSGLHVGIDTGKWWVGNPCYASMGIDLYRPVWLSSSADYFVFYAMYEPGATTLTYGISLAYKGSLDTAYDRINNALQHATDKLCAKLSDPRVQVAISLASKVPAAAPYAAVLKAVAIACAVVPVVETLVATDCVPQIDVDVATATYFSDGASVRVYPGAVAPGKRPYSADVGQSGWTTGTATAPARAAAYPVGSIAWLQPKSGNYRIAIPAPGPGTTHREVAFKGCWSTTGPCMPPPGVQIVDRTDWEKATLPWPKRTTTKVAAGAAVGVAAAVATTATVALRR